SGTCCGPLSDTFTIAKATKKNKVIMKKTVLLSLYVNRLNMLSVIKTSIEQPTYIAVSIEQMPYRCSNSPSSSAARIL
ncbi:MAG: hypothetical protein NWQ09_02245, partial [Nonlabens sp.]|nr:hypothetical protein [Nonlabens sp.]